MHYSTIDCPNRVQLWSLTLLLLLLFINPLLSRGQVVYVRESGTNSNPATATSWANALAGTALQGALASAQAGTTFLIGVGLYKPTGTVNVPGNDRSISFVVPNGVKVFGGYVGSNPTPDVRTAFPSSTTLSGDIDNNGILDNGNSYHVVRLTNVGPATRLDGFVITGGQATGNTFETQRGGGIYNDGSGPAGNTNPTFFNLHIVGNMASFHGGGMYNNGLDGGEGNATLTNIYFSQNTALDLGGGLYNNGQYGSSKPILTSVSFSQNTALDSGGGMFNNGFDGISSPTLTDVRFSQNSASNSGGAIYNLGSSGISSPVLTSTTFINNSAQFGGAIYNDGQNSGVSSPTLTNVSFSQNSAATNGGAIYNNGTGGNSSPTLNDVSFTQNSAFDSGGAIQNRGQAGICNPTLNRVSFVGNSARNGGAMLNNGQNNGISNPTLINVGFINNQAIYGGAIYNNGQNGGTTRPTLTNVSFSQNYASMDGGSIRNVGLGASLTLTNGIIFGNGITEFSNFNGTGQLTLRYSVISNTISTNSYTNGGGNITTPTSPFVSTNSLQLRPGSLAIDAGNNAAYSATAEPPTDLAGVGRFQGCRIDMGALESPYSTAPTPTLITQSTPNGLSAQVSGGVSYERLKFIDRINGYEIRQTEQNQTGYFLIQQPGPYSITVIGANGCRAVVGGTAP